MKKNLNLLTLFILLSLSALHGQLPNGSISPDFTITDVYGEEHSLYDKLDEGKLVIIDFFATWCSTCWNYHNSGALEGFMNDHGPDGTDQVFVYAVEADNNTLEQWIFGPPGNTRGDWTDGGTLNYPIMNAPTNTRTDFMVSGFPTIYAICPSNKQIYEIGRAPRAELDNWLVSCSLSASLDITSPDVLCFGDETGAATATASGGIGDLTYLWTDGTSTAENTTLAAGTHSVQVIEDQGHFVTLELTIAGPDSEVSLALTDMAEPLCNGDAMGMLTVEGGGGVGDFSYNWSNGMAGPTISNLTPGDYTVTVQDANLCETSAMFTITQPDVLIMNTDVTPANCNMEDGGIIIVAEGGTSPYMYDIGDGPIAETEFLNLPSGDYTISVIDVNACLTEATITIDNIPGPSSEAGDEKEITCDQTSVILDGSSDANGANITYLWTTNDGNIISGANTLNPTVDAEGTYSLAVVNTSTNCESIDQVTVNTSSEIPLAEAGAGNSFSCTSTNLTLDGNAQDGNTILWTTNDGNIVSGSDTQNPIIDAPGTYQISVTNPNTGCTNLDEVTIEDTRITPSGEYTLTKETLTIDAVATVTDSTANYNWDMGDGTSLIGATVSHTYSIEGDYNVCLNFENACGANQVCNLQSVRNGFSIEAVIMNVSCFGGSDGSISITPSNNQGDVSYVWSNGVEEISIDNLSVGPYSVIATDGANTSVERMFNITSPDEIIQSNISIENTSNGLDNGIIEIEINGGLMPYTYLWSNGITTEINRIENLAAAEYTLVVKDSNDCEKTFGPFEVQASTDLNEIEGLKNFEVFPNPISDYLSINLSFDQVTKGEVSLINTFGQVINLRAINSDQLTSRFDLRNLNAGVYMILVETEEGRAVRKIVKQ